jgi:hypothetical protein
MTNVMEQLKQTLQGVETLSGEQQVVKAQLESDMLPCTGLMTEDQLDLELRLRGADHLSAGWTVGEKRSTLRALRRQHDPGLTKNSGTGSNDGLQPKEPVSQMAKPTRRLNLEDRHLDVGKTTAAGLAKMLPTTTMDQTWTDEKDFCSGEPVGHTKPRRHVRFASTGTGTDIEKNDFLADDMHAERRSGKHQCAGQDLFDVPWKVNLPHLPLHSSVREVFRTLCNRSSLPEAKKRLQAAPVSVPAPVMSIEQVEAFFREPLLHHSKNEYVVATFSL